MIRTNVEIYRAFKGETQSFFKEMPVLNPEEFPPAILLPIY